VLQWRPAWWGRGTGAAATFALRRVRASMEPRPRGRGTRSLRRPQTARRSRFNGAPASRPGNELAEDLAAALHPASMEPRPRGRGTLRVGDELTLREELQWSPGLAAGERRDHLGTRTGRGSFNGAPASRPGNGPIAAESRRGSPASMEPRPRGRGTSSASSMSRARAGLQWSPGLAAGERDQREAESPARVVLQWSPGLAAGERRMPITDSMAHQLLQWSPGLAAGERRRGGPQPEEAGLASMEPRPRGRGTVPGVPARGERLLASMEPRPRGRGTVKP